MAAYVAVASLMNTTEHIMNHPHLSTYLDAYQIHSLREKACFLLDMMEGDNYVGSSKEAEELEIQIAFAAHAAEDVIESRIVDQIRAGTTQVSRSSSLHMQYIVEGIDTILERANESKKEEGFRLREEEQPSSSRPNLLETKESAMVGFEEELIQIMDELTNQRSSTHTISIVGMGGMGKTTLAHNLYHHLLIKQRFDIRAWATVSQLYNVSRILSELLSGHGKHYGRSVDELGQQLHKTLYGRRYLIILDDIWSVQVWDELSRFFPNNGNGSRILLTTRLSNVANDSRSSCFTMNLLDKDKSWELFCKKAFQQEKCPYVELEEVGKEIVELCKGLPLSIVVIGGSLLKSPRTLGHWKNIALDIRSVPNSKEKQESFDVLLSSYHHLPARLKPCFLYIGVFKARFSEIHVSEIIKLWVAEGFLKSNCGRVLEEIGEDYIKDLIDRNLVFVSRRHDNGKMKCCKVHDILRDLCLKVAMQQEFFHVSGGLTKGTERRLIMFSTSMTETVRATTLARSITASEVDNQELDKHKLLRILDAYNHVSSEEAFRSVNLRYLAMAYPNAWESEGVWELPTSVSLLWNLHTLIFGKLWIFKTVVAPIEIWKMQQLRHIKCPQIYLPHPSQPGGLSVLENLRTLKTLVNFRLSEEVCEIIPNIKKLHLLYYGEFQGYGDCIIDCLCNLARLQKLESLKLIGRQPWQVPYGDLNKILTFPSSLNKLILKHCQLHWDDLTMIGSLPLLEVLKLDFLSVTEGKVWSPITGQFLLLKFLKIGYCNLRCWNAESCHFPVLEKLVLEGLSELEEIPWGIGEIPTLQVIFVDRCSLSTTISAMKIKEDHLECQGNDDLHIQVEYTSDLESFREMVEKEGLTINNIQLKIYPI